MKANEQGRVRARGLEAPSFDSTARGLGEPPPASKTRVWLRGAASVRASGLPSPPNLDETELCHFYDDRDLDEDVGVSTRSRYVWRFTFDGDKGFWPIPRS